MKTFIIYAAVGIVFILFGASSMKKTKAKSARCVAPAMGRIVRVDVELEEKGDGHRKHKSYVPVFQYIVNEKSVESSSNLSSTDKKTYQVGDTAEILFNPAKPEEFVIKGKSEKSGKGFGIAMILLGIVLIALSISQL